MPSRAESRGLAPCARVADLAAASTSASQTATYRVTTPGGTWDEADNGTYTISLMPGEMSDTSGNFAQSGTLGSFNVAIGSEPVAANRFGNFEGRTGVTLTLPSSNGSFVTFALKGGGYGVVDGESGTDPIALIGTTGRSVLKVTSKSRASEVGDITVDGSARSLRLKSINVTGNINVSGTLGSLMANHVVGPGTITISSARADGAPVTLRMNHVTDMTVNSAMPIRNVIVTGWTNTDDIEDTITAPSIGKLQVRTARRGAPFARSGAFEAGLELTGRGTALGVARIANGMSNAGWNIVGSVGKISAGGAIEDWAMAVGSSVTALQLGNVISADVEIGGYVGRVMTASGSITGLNAS